MVATSIKAAPITEVIRTSGNAIKNFVKVYLREISTTLLYIIHGITINKKIKGNPMQ